MHPIFLKFGPFTLYWYAIWVVIGILAGYRLFKKRAMRIGVSEKDAFNLVLLLFWTGVFGARVYYVIWKWTDEFSSHPLEIILINHGGLVFFGGFLTASLALITWARFKQCPLLLLADALAAPLALGHAFGRVGCFMGGCCYGRECHFPWAVQLDSPAEIVALPVHPTQLYESMGLFYIVVSLLVIEMISRYPGQVAGSYALLYSVLRFVVEFFRGDVPHHLFGHFTTAQAICVLLFITAWLFSSRLAWQATKGRVKKEDPGPAAKSPNDKKKSVG